MTGVRSFYSMALFALLFPAGAGAATLFPRPLHVTRSVGEPLSGKTFVVEEYYFGGRAITTRAERTVIVDYDRREITEIDRANATYSVTRFDAAAAAHGPRVARKPAAALVRSGPDRRGGRNVEVFTADDPNDALHAEIAVDPTIDLSRDAFDVVIGAAYPGDGGAGADLARGAARMPGKGVAAVGATAADRYGLPIEQIFRWEAGGETITSTNRVTRVGEEMVPPDLIAIPPGARLVESHRQQTRRLSDEIDSTPAPRRQRQP